MLRDRRFHNGKSNHADLALAQACAAGDSAAWQQFLARYTAKLQGAAFSLVKDKLLARELTDTLFADLFANGSAPSSKLASYTGRGSLESWLKVLLFQANIDRYRSERRFTTFDENVRQLAGSSLIAFDPAVQSNEKFEMSLREAIQDLNLEERLILAGHFFDQQNLACIARLLHVHESTVSRRLQKALTKIRKGVARKLKRSGLQEPGLANLYEINFGNISLDLHAELLFGIDTVKERF
jgi:RNA polymerase sigma-70 factor (ECF subfamily)